VTDVEVEVTADELEAEIIRGRLEAEGIPARVAHRSSIGVPRGWSPMGLGFGVGSFSVRVPEPYQRQARDVLGTREAPPARMRRPPAVVSLIAILILIGFLFANARYLAEVLPDLMR
jgi:hypothetical protein